MGFPGSVPSLFTQPACRYPRVSNHIVFQRFERGCVAPSLSLSLSCFTCYTFPVIVFAVSTVEYMWYMCSGSGFGEVREEEKEEKRENLEIKEN